MEVDENDEALTFNRPKHEQSTEMEMLLPTAAEVFACQFSSWYPIFSNLSTKYKRRSNVTIKSIVLDNLPDDFRDYLNSNRLILPANTRTSSALLEAHASRGSPEWSSDDDADAEHDVVDPEEVCCFSFPVLNRQIDDAIAELGGAVIPKLNWSAPKDAVWVNGGTMECRFAGDVYMLLKASDFCSYDVHHALLDVVVAAAAEEEDASTAGVGSTITTTAPIEAVATSSSSVSCSPPKTTALQLVLRKWCNLYPSQEFRCFVRNRELIAISQRHHSQHWPHLSEHREQIQSLITDFFESVLLVVENNNSFTTLVNYAYDVYIDQRQRVWLLDLNVWASRTDALLFEWSELQQKIEKLELRLVETDRQVRPDPLASYKAPIDTLHMASSGNSSNFHEFMGMCERPSKLDSDDDDDKP